MNYIKQQIHKFIAYGYFCLGNYEQCQKHYDMQLSLYPNSKTDAITYNIALNKAYLLYEKNKF